MMKCEVEEPQVDGHEQAVAAQSMKTAGCTDGTGKHKLASVGSVAGSFCWSPDGKVIRFDKSGSIWEMSADGSGIHQALLGREHRSFAIFQVLGRTTQYGSHPLRIALVALPESGYECVRAIGRNIRKRDCPSRDRDGEPRDLPSVDFNLRDEVRRSLGEIWAVERRGPKGPAS
jgi:hypothetical protein